MCEGLTCEAFAQYLCASSSHRSLRLRLFQIVQSIVETLLSKVPGYIDRSTILVDTGRSEYDLATCVASPLRKPCMKPEGNHLTRLYETLHTFLNHLKISHSHGAYRTILLDNLVIDIIQLLTLRIIQSLPIDSVQDIVFHEFIEMLKSFYKESDFREPGSLALDSFGYVDTQLSTFPDAKDRFIAMASPLSDDAILRAQFEEILKLSSENRIGRFPRDSKGRFVPNFPPVVTYGDFYFHPLRRAQVVAIARIGLDPQSVFREPAFVTRSNGSQVLEHYPSPGSIELQLDRSTGHFCPVSTNIPLSVSSHFGSSSDSAFYRALQALVYSHLLRYLKEEATRPMPDHFVAAPNDDAFSEQPSDFSGEGLEFVDPALEVVNHRAALRGGVEAALSDLDGRVSLPPKTEKPISYAISELRGLSDARIRRFLLGFVVNGRRGHSGHVRLVYEGQQFPFSLHPSQSLDLDTLAYVLNHLQIPKEVFFDAVGGSSRRR